MLLTAGPHTNAGCGHGIQRVHMIDLARNANYMLITICGQDLWSRYGSWYNQSKCMPIHGTFRLSPCFRFPVNAASMWPPCFKKKCETWEIDRGTSPTMKPLFITATTCLSCSLLSYGTRTNLFPMIWVRAHLSFCSCSVASYMVYLLSPLCLLISLAMSMVSW